MNPVEVNTILKILLPSDIMSLYISLFIPPPPPPKYQSWSVSRFTDKHFKNNIEIGGGGNSEKLPFLLQNIQFDVFAKLFCLALWVGWGLRLSILRQLPATA